jgi:hypothetical protein
VCVGKRALVIWGLFGTILPWQGCLSHTLDRKPVRQISEAERRSRTRMAYDRARERVRVVRAGMDQAEVQAALRAVIAVEERDGGDSGQRKLIDGFLCRVNPTERLERWLFGYDEGGVQLVGFVVEFERRSGESSDWVVRRVDRAPHDDCPAVGDTFLE